MTVGKAIYYLLNNSTDLEAVVGTRIFPEVAEQDSALPFVMYSVISNEPSDTHSGPSLLDVAQVDVIAYNTSYSGCIDMGVYVRAALDRVTGTYNGVNVQSCQYNSEVIDFDEYKRAYVITQSYDVRISRTEFEIAQGTPVTGARLGDLYDVTDDATTGQVIIKQADGTWAGGDAAATLGDLTDVTIDDPQDREALVYDQDANTWINGASTKLAIRVINQTGNTLLAGTPVKASGVQGDQVKVTVYQAGQDPKLYIGMLDSDIPNGGTGYARQTGAIYNLNTAHLNVGDILYVNELSLIGNNGLFYLSTTAPTGTFGTPVAKIPTAIVLRKHENTGRVYVRTWSPDSTLDELANVSASNKSAGDVLVWNGSVWAAGATLAPSLYELRDVFDYSGATLKSGTILAWDATNGYWFPQPKISFLPDNSVYYLGQYDTEAGTGRTAASTASVTVERYLTIQGDGEGESISAQSDTPSSGNKIVRKIWYKANSFEQSDVDTWTLVHTFADDTAYSATEATFEALLNAQTYGTPPFTLAQSWEDVPAFTGLLDTYPGAAAAYSLRLLDADYSGSAINVRRASDNAVQDIGFDANGDLDTSALATFCAGTDGYVVRWYDQSGNSNDAVQATTSAQPQIVASGSVVVVSGSPAVSFDGSNDYLQSTYTNANNYTAFWAQLPVNGVGGQVIGRGDLSGRHVAGWFGSSVGHYRGGSADIQAAGATARYIGYTLSLPSSISCRVGYNGSTGSTNSAIGTSTLTSMILGAERGSLSLYGQSKIHEIILYPSDQSANRTGIESNINTYYSIY